jgi:hypothetical protein
MSANCRLSHARGVAHQVENASRMLLLVRVLHKVHQTLASLAGPCDNRVSDLGLLATQVLAQVGLVDWLLAEPKVLLGETEGAAVLSDSIVRRKNGRTHFFKPGAL